MEHAESEYDTFSRLRVQEADKLSSDFDDAVKKIPAPRQPEEESGN